MWGREEEYEKARTSWQRGVKKGRMDKWHVSRLPGDFLKVPTTLPSPSLPPACCPTLMHRASSAHSRTH